ncbi:putative Methyltransferase type 12 [Sterolibacterium denitrificans]|uniref:Methyltransferase type 12 n=1 Tax=Sterolibacterium denitrificans TaxID=157592 RepID=A0A7Z7HS03_9PROT|nr:hypothetical protein [Sterolibacterium denitrificans]SMB28663.1 putative Methyltransferase type 12 [Sterolibacterium denitrificans]
MNMAFRHTDLGTLAAPPAMATLQRIGDGFRDYQVVRAGFASGLFDWLKDNGPAEKSTIAGALELRGAHLGAFLQTLEDLGLLARHGSAYILAPGMEAVLCKSSAWCQAETLAALAAPTCGWSDMAAFMSARWVQPARGASSIERHPLLQDARQLAARLLKREAVARARTLICFDGADGLLSAALCQALPELRASVVVPAGAVPQAEMLLAECNVADRCKVLPGTPLDLPANGMFDLAILFHSLYPVRKSTVDALSAVAARLASGGELCSAHWFCLEACESAPGGRRDLDKAVLTDSHPLCHVEQFGQRLEDAGLVDDGREDLPGEFGNTKLHFGRKA